MRISKKKQTYAITHHIRVKQQHFKVNKHHCVSPLWDVNSTKHCSSWHPVFHDGSSHR